MISQLTTLEEIMKRFRPGFFVFMSGEFGSLTGPYNMEAIRELYGQTILGKDDTKKAIETFTLFGAECAEAGLALSAMTVRKIVDLLTGPGAPPVLNELSPVLDELRVRLSDEMESRKFIQLESEKALLAFEPHQFGEKVDIAFSQATWDIEEAARCLAFDRWTSAVFHLGRVAEIATVTIGKRVGYESPKEGFGEVLKYLDANLKKAREDYKNAKPEFKGDIEFVSGMTVQMHAVNEAWRQRVAHMDKKYTEEEAMRVWDTTRTLMQHLATKLSEEPTA